MNCTVPVAALDEMVAVKLIESPNVDGFSLEVTVAVVGAVLTVWVSEPVLPAKLLSPL